MPGDWDWRQVKRSEKGKKLLPRAYPQTHLLLRGWIRDQSMADLLKDAEVVTLPEDGKLLQLSLLINNRQTDVPVFLTDWDHATIEKMDWDAQHRELQLQVQSDRPVQLIFRAWEDVPVSIRLNDQTVTPHRLVDGFTNLHREMGPTMGPRFAVSLPAGSSTVQMDKQ